MIEIFANLWLALAAADTACAESGTNYKDGAIVLQVVRNRAVSGWDRYTGSLKDALFKKHQHAHGCRAPITAYHLKLGWQFVNDTLVTPEWARRALWYCGNYDKPLTCEKRCKHGCEPLGKEAHTFYGYKFNAL